MAGITAHRAPESAPRQQLHMGVYFREDNIHLTYLFTVGRREEIKDSENYRLLFSNRPLKQVSLKTIHSLWRDDLARYLYGSSGSPVNAAKRLGYMSYFKMEIDDFRLALAESYEPRKYLGPGLARKLPYFMEAVAMQHLKGMRFTHVSPGATSSDRQRQLGPVGLWQTRLGPLGSVIIDDVEIDRWLRGMGRGIGMALRGEFRDFP